MTGVGDVAISARLSPGGAPGDMIVEVRVLEHAHFTRDGHDLCLEVPITLGEAFHGATVRIPTLEGAVNIRVPPRVQGGAKLRLRAKGVPVKNGGRGDLLVRLNLRLPWDAADQCEEPVAALEGKYDSDVRASLFEDE